MTAQMPDALLVENQKFSIVGVNGNGLFDPYEHDMHPVPRATNCWRGYMCEYSLLHNRLFLTTLQINLTEEPAVVHGVTPRAVERGLFSHTYSGLGLQVDFTGGILAARDFIQALYVHMGFHPAWKYRHVVELILSHGHVLEARDVSDQMDAIRSQRIKSPLKPEVGATREQIESWVDSTFRLDYNF